MEDLYRKSLLKAVDYLMEVRHNLFSNAVDIAMNSKLNELEQLNNLAEVGELREFKNEYLQNSSVNNLKKIAELIKVIELSVESITKINNIDDSELGQEI